ncbi:FecR domain-containing protein [Novosphingobium sp. 1949]|uniref:FecR domain-containing protein n=1 Tax=Novosphingobium organovorum TaxID=2930092 RepID=A0ABT0BDY0_9SPHN|nr:FecR domain-containing protein [Novosphingobium organovorum]MCJ2183001.1 FecR domain-containing protein [Novosphingobium organovorum]
MPTASGEELETQAARLAVRLPDADPAEARAIMAWVAQSPRHAIAFARAEAAWKDCERLKALGPDLPKVLRGEDAAHDAVSAQPETDEARSGWRLSRRRLMLSGVAAAALAGLWPLSRLVLDEGQVFTTERGEVREVRLADGSVLHLDTDSRVVVSLSPHRRDLRLEQGAASFDVAHDAARPFEVTAGGSVTRAIGTRFTIDTRALSDAGRVEVTVSEGVVSVRDRAGQQVRVAAGNAATVRGDALATRRLDPAALEQRTAWQNRMLILDGMTLGEAAAAFSRYRAHPILVEDPALAATRMGGRFGLGEADQFLAALQAGFDVDVERAGDGTVRIAPARR